MPFCGIGRGVHKVESGRDWIQQVDFELGLNRRRTLKRIPARAMRMGEPKGTKVIHCYDPAIVDYRLWTNWKQSQGVYIITLEKSISALEFVSVKQWDASDPRNNGVVFDDLAIMSEYGGI